MELSLLAEKENAIINGVHAIPWDTHFTDDPQYQPYYDQYNEVHRHYASCVDSNLEALKRAVFIQWYSMSEPSPLSGIGDLDQESMRAVMTELDNRLALKQIDDELSWMLTHYIRVMEYPFVQYSDLVNLHNLVDRMLTEYRAPDYPKSIDRDGMAQRGGMGRYWNSMSIFP